MAVYDINSSKVKTTDERTLQNCDHSCNSVKDGVVNIEVDPGMQSCSSSSDLMSKFVLEFVTVSIWEGAYFSTL